jgi:hypothetical protein
MAELLDVHALAVFLGWPPEDPDKVHAKGRDLIDFAAQIRQQHLPQIHTAVRTVQLANKGPATNAFVASVVGPDGHVGRLNDLADGMHIAGLATTAWAMCVRALRAFIASQAIQIAVAAATGAGAWFAAVRSVGARALVRKFADHLMERLIKPAFRRARELFAVVERKRSARTVEKAAGRLHDQWRSARRLETGGYEPRVKTTADASWIDKHGTDQVDIANTRYKDLPADWQKENKASASVAVKIAADAREQGVDLRSSEFMESASEKVHIAWLERNGEWAPTDQKLPYAELSEAEKEKDRVVVRTALGL